MHVKAVKNDGYKNSAVKTEQINSEFVKEVKLGKNEHHSNGIWIQFINQDISSGELINIQNNVPIICSNDSDVPQQSKKITDGIYLVSIKSDYVEEGEFSRLLNNHNSGDQSESVTQTNTDGQQPHSW